ncbi:MAG TPA: RDD family protein [Candidatus Acidoferrales bacterium]
MTGGAPSCPSCGETIPDPSSNVGATSSVRFAIAPVVYAGFWLRAVAFAIDNLLLGIVAGWVILKPMMDRAGIPLDNPMVFVTDTSRQMLALKLAVLAAGWLYWALLESSAWQATLGKKILGLRVTDLEGRRISFARASGRYFGKLFSQLILLIGFLMAAFTARKQALHDMIAGCLVVRSS